MATNLDKLNARLRAMGREEFGPYTPEQRKMIDKALNATNATDPWDALVEICESYNDTEFLKGLGISIR
jgi:hypothetical protein